MSTPKKIIDPEPQPGPSSSDTVSYIVDDSSSSESSGTLEGGLAQHHHEQNVTYLLEGSSDSTDSESSKKIEMNKNIEFSTNESRIRLFSAPLQQTANENKANNELKCTRYCKSNCDEIVKAWDKETKSKMHKLFKKDSLVKTKEALLTHLKHQETLGKDTKDYYLYGHSFCLKAFCSLTDITYYIAQKVLNDYQEGTANYVHGNSG